MPPGGPPGGPPFIPGGGPRKSGWPGGGPRTLPGGGPPGYPPLGPRLKGGDGPRPPPPGPGLCAMLWFRLSLASLRRAASNSSSPTVLAEISGSLWSTLRLFFRVPKISVSIFLRSVILAGSPMPAVSCLFEFTWL